VVHPRVVAVVVDELMYCTVLYCTVLSCTVLFCTALYSRECGAPRLLTAVVESKVVHPRVVAVVVYELCDGSALMAPYMGGPQKHRLR